MTSFSDVKTTAWYYKDVMECAKLGIVAGFENGTFRSDDKVSIVFIVLKLIGVINWGWGWVLAPLWIPVLIILVCAFVSWLTD